MVQLLAEDIKILKVPTGMLVTVPVLPMVVPMATVALFITLTNVQVYGAVAPLIVKLVLD